MKNKTPLRLLVIMSDRFSDFVKKGEIINRYLNPGNLFDEVALLLTNDDAVPQSMVKPMFGKARFSIHNLPSPRFSLSLGWNPIFLRKWTDRGVKLAEQLKPDVIRSYGNADNGYLSAHIKKHLGIPLVVSLHSEPDEDVRGKTPWWPHWKDRLVRERQRYFEKEALKAADWVLPVYKPIIEYAKKCGAQNIRVCYNMTNLEHLRQKDDYCIHNPPQLLSVGRQSKREKNPENVIRAVARLKAKLTLVGDGPYHDALKRIAGEQSGPGEYEFIRALPNSELCQKLPNFDIFVTQTEYFEISKSVLEALLTGLPVVLNRRKGKQVPELEGDWVRHVEDTPESFFGALRDLIDSQEAREALGRRAYQHSQNLYSPIKTEQAFVDVYQSLLHGTQ